MDSNRSFVVFAAVALLAPLARAEEFAPIKASELVTYPLPPVPFPAVPDGKWAETEDSPALRVSRAWVKLGQAAGVERSEATRRLYQAWKNEVAKDGTHGRVAQAAHAKFLRVQGIHVAQHALIDGARLVEVLLVRGEELRVRGLGDPADKALLGDFVLPGLVEPPR